MFRIEDASNDNNITSGGPPGDDSGSGGAGESGSSSGCSSLGGSGSGGSSKYALEDNEEDPDYKEVWFHSKTSDSKPVIHLKVTYVTCGSF